MKHTLSEKGLSRVQRSSEGKQVFFNGNTVQVAQLQGSTQNLLGFTRGILAWIFIKWLIKVCTFPSIYIHSVRNNPSLSWTLLASEYNVCTFVRKWAGRSFLDILENLLQFFRRCWLSHLLFFCLSEKPRNLHYAFFFFFRSGLLYNTFLYFLTYRQFSNTADDDDDDLFVYVCIYLFFGKSIAWKSKMCLYWRHNAQHINNNKYSTTFLPS